MTAASLTSKNWTDQKLKNRTQQNTKNWTLVSPHSWTLQRLKNWTIQNTKNWTLVSPHSWILQRLKNWTIQNTKNWTIQNTKNWMEHSDPSRSCASKGLGTKFCAQLFLIRFRVSECSLTYPARSIFRHFAQKFYQKSLKICTF